MHMEHAPKSGGKPVNILSYALFSYGLTAVISLLLIAVIVGTNMVMEKLNIQDEEEQG